ncbi:MAG: DUF3127 domain-containing protein [Bacteroidales bacterium]|jgi:hypothetical protein|nr:DUF3127 domain-containing protein [Bacteroidales bacterium]
MSFEITGKIIEIYNTQQINDKFKKRDFVIEQVNNNSGRDFIEHIKFQLLQDKTGLIDKYSMNDEVKVSFNIKGKRWERDGKVSYFTNLDAWKIEGNSQQAPSGNVAPPPSIDDLPPEGDEDLPF